MPKGKPKKRNPNMYHGSTIPQPRSMAPQAVAHKRGGTHRVKDSDRTDSIYDNYNYKELLDATKERALYRKDMKKVEMAKALKDDDTERRRAERHAIVEREKKQQEEKKAQQKRDAERQAASKAYHERRIKREERRARCEMVSDDSLSDAEPGEEHAGLDVVNEYTSEKIGYVVSDESWDSTSSESTVRSVNQPIIPDCKLRLFEWPYSHMPVTNPLPMLPTSPDRHRQNVLLERLPWTVPYAPLKVITTETKQKLFLPGQKYPAGVNPDYVPVLSLQTRSAARNGILEGVLRKATIEKAAHWAERTQVQGWNARMYFNLPARNEFKDLAETYVKWNLENRKLLRVKGRGDGVPADRERRHAQRYINKEKKTMEVYEASQYRPLAVCYIPSYLDFDSNPRRGDHKHPGKYCSLENLFFIRFPGCDLPHYYFWTRVGEWEDPTVPNAGWDRTKVQEKPFVEVSTSEDSDTQKNTRRPARKQPYNPWKAPFKRWIRVKKPDAIQGSSVTSEQTKFATTLTKVEHELYSHGLAATLGKYRTKWAANRKLHTWKIFAHALPGLYPSGQIPDAPPVETHAGTNVAIKLAMIDSLGEDGKTPLSPLKGHEPWTRDDDKFWDVVEVDVEETEMMAEEDIPEELECSEDALYRRFSITSHESHEQMANWLHQISPSYVPPTPTSLPTTPSAEDVNFKERHEWEDRFLRLPDNDTSATCPFCCIAWETMSSEAKADHMLSHSDKTDVRARRSPAEQTLLFSLPHAGRKLNRRTLATNNSFFDASMDGDIDTPITSKPPKRASRPSTSKFKVRRPSAEIYTPVSPSTHDPFLTDHDKELSNLKGRTKFSYSNYRIRPVALSTSSVGLTPMQRRRRKTKGSADVDASTVVQEKIHNMSVVKPEASLVDDNRKRKARGDDLGIERDAKRPRSRLVQSSSVSGWCAVM
ncbi:uncharacterized protein K460DRAFT_169033 [Cucurbitaria berberidis CBS 394.84]|uniref:Uncharacterized protein n=1 Tax=Cucurbitaria berberidis CBS 394.84 TaxID=1168544 RepID=A0A9P4GA82_9PLEO|nr:uncharacterized protein K460DRAFT_169033 [Cucurbitaria berberidis CBS 394.84]KAF1841540.1 hypothetical protein K460DRAFT_169033 [Cucurbitaria berberidis CBS 394.84]